MARQSEWEQVGIKVIPIGSKYRVVVQSILDVLGIRLRRCRALPADLSSQPIRISSAAGLAAQGPRCASFLAHSNPHERSGDKDQ